MSTVNRLVGGPGRLLPEVWRLSFKLAGCRRSQSLEEGPGQELKRVVNLRKGNFPCQDSINRRFKRVLATFTIWSILLELGAPLGLGLLSFRPPGLN